MVADRRNLPVDINPWMIGNCYIGSKLTAIKSCHPRRVAIICELSARMVNSV